MAKSNNIRRVISCYCENGAAEDGEKSCVPSRFALRIRSPTSEAVFDENFQYSHSSCTLCNGYYSPNFGEPVCATCHAFVFPDDLTSAHPVLIYSEETDDGDSGNDEPSELWPERRQSQNREVAPPDAALQDHGYAGNAGMPMAQPQPQPPPPLPPPPLPPPPLPPPPPLAKRIEMLSTPQVHGDAVSPGLVARLPPEVLLTLFSYMDDLSLWSCARVCKRWRHLLQSHVPDSKWQRDTARRWPLFRPLHTVDNWFRTYSKLVGSSLCRMCLQQMSAQIQPTGVDNMWRRNRLLNELRTLRTDPPEGIEAVPLDDRYCHWQATIMGPADSPYAGGIFYLYLQVPCSYPMCPPVVRFLTRIFHPNVSRHGDVGIDSIHDNWSLVLTLSKVLISIQSLLTDPFCEVCMEPEVGKLYLNDRQAFDNVARAWTWRFAMIDAMNDDSDL